MNGEAAHTFGEWQTVIAATHTTSGLDIHSCTVCHYAETLTTNPVDPDLHTYDTSKWASDASGHWFAANCGHNEKQGFNAHNFTYVKADNSLTAADGTKTLLQNGTEPSLIQLDWRTASNSDVVFFQLQVTDGQSHKIRVETEFAYKEFTVIPDVPAAIEVQYSVDDGQTWTAYSSSVSLTVGQKILLKCNIENFTVSVSDNYAQYINMEQGEGFVEITAVEVASRCSVSFAASYYTKSISLKIVEAAQTE